MSSGSDMKTTQFYLSGDARVAWTGAARLEASSKSALAEAVARVLFDGEGVDPESREAVMVAVGATARALSADRRERAG